MEKEKEERWWKMDGYPGNKTCDFGFLMLVLL